MITWLTDKQVTDSLNQLLVPGTGMTSLILWFFFRRHLLHMVLFVCFSFTVLFLVFILCRFGLDRDIGSSVLRSGLPRFQIILRVDRQRGLINFSNVSTHRWLKIASTQMPARRPIVATGPRAIRHTVTTDDKGQWVKQVTQHRWMDHLWVMYHGLRSTEPYLAVTTADLILIQARLDWVKCLP